MSKEGTIIVFASPERCPPAAKPSVLVQSSNAAVGDYDGGSLVIVTPAAAVSFHEAFEVTVPDSKNGPLAPKTSVLKHSHFASATARCLMLHLNGQCFFQLG
mmetsp:Transcript_18320/g.25745  ORF Transcript_18320/g.25745 Transcript_18320/m.25745 type:complete len:102 (+) Transcript_18320:1994-2299(+)